MNKLFLSASEVPTNDGKYEEYQDRLCVGRERELGLLRGKIRLAQKEPLSEPLIEAYGVVGIGKSWLLERIRDRFRYGQEDSLRLNGQRLDKPTLTALVDFEEFSPSDLATRAQEARFAEILFALLKPLVDEIVRQTEEQGEVVTPPLYFATEHPPSLKKIDEVAIAFKDFIYGLSERKVPILLFDTTEQLFRALPERDSVLLDWLEDNVFYPLVRTYRVILVFSGRRRLRWKKFEVKRRVTPHHLEPFNKDDAERQLIKLAGEKGETVARAIYEYSFGHPYTNKVIFDELWRLSKTQGVALDQGLLARNEGKIAEIIDRRIIEEKFLEDLAPILKSLLRLITIVRKFNANPLRYFASRFIAPQYEQEAGAFYLGAIRDMVDSTLVEWSLAHGGYVLDPVVRKIMSKHLWVTDAEGFKERHRAAIQLYDRWIESYPENSGTYLIEELFHLLNLRRAEKTPDESIREELLTIFREATIGEKSRLPQNMDMALSLSEELAQDDELEETISSVSKVAFQDLSQVAQDFVAKFTGKPA